MELLKYWKEKNNVDALLYDHLRYVLDAHIYHYGNHFKNSLENESRTSFSKKNIAKDLYIRYKYYTQKRLSQKSKVLSNAYFNFNTKLEELDFYVAAPPWAVKKIDKKVFGNIAFYNYSEKINKLLRNDTFINLTSKRFLDEVLVFKKNFAGIVEEQNIKALFVPNDVNFFENISIDIFKKLKRPSFTFLHGLPARYNSIDEKRTDYLLVWGDKIKQHYIDSGFSGDRIFVTGHPAYPSPSIKDLKFDLLNVLVLAKVGVGSPHSEDFNLYSRGSLIIYLLMIHNTLTKIGIKKVRLRVHPSANLAWFYQFIDKNFFEEDNLPLNQSLNQSSLVIGPSSSVLLEALFYGINYVVFEPEENGNDILNSKLVPPFDGSLKEVPVAKNEEDLEEILRNKIKVNKEILKEYYNPFNIDFLKELINSIK
ncbi:MAG: hypothetical protein ACTHJ2_01135 [Candidatus Nitrosocosmicus sp.]